MAKALGNINNTHQHNTMHTNENSMAKKIMKISIERMKAIESNENENGENIEM